MKFDESKKAEGDLLIPTSSSPVEVPDAHVALEGMFRESSNMSHYVAHLKYVLVNIQLDERYLSNTAQGRPRRGHPEGTVAAHIRELDANLKQIEEHLAAIGSPLSPTTKAVLEILIHVHDSFKAEAQPRVRIEDPRSHASIAREFLASKIDDPNILAMVQNHDVPWSLYQQFQKYGNFDSHRLIAMTTEIATMETFQLFQIIDNTTFGKIVPGGQSSVKWFIQEAAPYFEATLDLNSIAVFLENKVSRIRT